MKKLAILLLVLLLLAGCTNDVDPTEPPTDPTEPTQPPKPWTETAGMPWDSEGVLLEMPLTIPDGLHYSSMTGFGGDLLLWSIDTHLTDKSVLEMCLVELDDGTVLAQRDITLASYTAPQILGDALYLCDTHSGQILQLNKELKTVKEWSIEPEDGNWYMGAGEILYQLSFESRLTARNLANGTASPVMEGDPEVSWMSPYGRYAAMDYFRVDTGMGDVAVLDLVTGEVYSPSIEGSFNSATLLNNDWLCSKYINENLTYLSVDGGPAMLITDTDSHYTLLEEGYLLENNSGGHLAIYDMEGHLVSAATIFENESAYPDTDMIWNEALGGYFLELRSYDESSRLLFWDINKSAEGTDLILTEVPEPDEAQAQLRQRAKDLGIQYGLTILVGDECDTVFDEFTAERVEDWERVTMALNTLEEALGTYPGGFLRQLRYDNIRGIQIQLIGNLWADGSGRYGDGYSAFAQPRWDHYLVVLDIDDTTAQTYYHEFSHIIDAYLEWDAMQRSDALFSEDRWADLNPDWFTGYSYDYSQEHYLYDYNSFIDSYSTIKPTEDRARVMENAMAGYDWTFDDAPGVRKKLDYYCRCIRDAFDATGWPETAPWEEPLK